VEFRILGPLEVVSDTGVVKVPGAKCRALLAMLLIRANTVVTADRLIEELWEAAPPDSAPGTLQSYVYQVRKCLPPGSLHTRAGGYLLEVEARDVDAVRFEGVLAEVSRGEELAPHRVAGRLTEALEWWRGAALADFESAPWAQAEAARLNGLRLDAIESLTEARLMLGEHLQLVAALETLVGQHPLRERLWAQLMLALYRSNRQADALRAYGRLRRRLGEELGIEPSRELARLEEAILLQKPELDWQPPPRGQADSLAGASVPVPHTLRRAASDLFVGRRAEVDLLMRAWKDARAGDPRVVFVSGEPGVGKTRLAAELAQIVSAEGTDVLYGHCEEDIGIPYQPWVEALRHRIGEEPRALFAELAADYVDALARLMPEVAREFGEPASSPTNHPEAQRYLLFAAVVGLLARACSECPVLLVLEDLHWADKQSLLLLRHVIGSSDPRRLLIVGTYRPTDLDVDHPLTDVLAAMHRERQVQRLDMHGLSDTEVIGLLESMAGHALDDAGIAFAHAVYRETDGNPFFTNEIVRHLAETGVISRDDDGGWTAAPDFSAHAELPTSVREVIGRRVARLGVDTERTLRAAAVIGRGFELDLLARVTEQTEHRLLDLLDPAIRAVLIRDVPQRSNAFSFSHALVEHALYDDLGPSRQRQLHLRVATALETLCGDDPGDRVGELAYHWSRAGSAADPAKAIDYARRAGDRALTQCAPDDAVGWYSRVLDLFDRQPVVDEHARCELLVDLGIAQRMAGDRRNRDTLDRAAHLARRLASPPLLVRVALANNQEGRTSYFRASDPERSNILEAALRATDETETPERARLLATLVELTTGEPERASELSDEALDMARRVDDDRTLWEVLYRRAFAIWSPATLDERTADAYELREVAERLGDGTFGMGTARNLLLTAACRGDLAEVDQNLDVMIRLGAKTGVAQVRWEAALALSWRRLLAGHIDEAERAAVEALQIASQAEELDAYPLYGPQLYAIRRAQGRLDEMIEPLERAVSANPELALNRAALLDALCSVDRLDDARALLEPLAANRFTDFPIDNAWLTALTFCAEGAASLEHRAAAALLATLLAPWRDQLDFTGISCNGSVARPLGLALATAGRFDEADGAFAQATAVHERIDAPIDLARTRVDWASMLMNRGAPGDPEKARTLLNAALKTADRLGLIAIKRQARTLSKTLAANDC
jgi:DNA-binding SARP family transcriptional activator